MTYAKITDYGFEYNGTLVERIASSDGKRKYTLIHIVAMNGDRIEVLMQPRKNTITTFKKAKK